MEQWVDINTNGNKTNTNSSIPQKQIGLSFLSAQLSWHFELSSKNAIISNTWLNFIHSLALYVELSVFVLGEGKRKSLMTFCKYQLMIFKTISFSQSQLYPLEVYSHLPSIKTNLISKHVILKCHYSTPPIFLGSGGGIKNLWLPSTFWRARLYLCIECVQ